MFRPNDKCSVAKPFHSKSNYQGAKNLPLCFVCFNLKCRHFLIDYKKFMAFSRVDKRQCVFNAKKYLNCLSLDHFVRDCKGLLSVISVDLIAVIKYQRTS